MPTYTFSCAACGWREDQRVGLDTVTVSCSCCQLPAARVSVYAVNFGGFARTPAGERDYSHEYRQFQEAAAETKTVLPSFHQAKALARTLKRKGVRDANDIPSRL